MTSNSGTESSGPPIGPIVGGAIGGLAIIAIAATAIVFIVARRRREPERQDFSAGLSSPSQFQHHQSMYGPPPAAQMVDIKTAGMDIRSSTVSPISASPVPPLYGPTMGADMVYEASGNIVGQPDRNGNHRGQMQEMA